MSQYKTIQANTRQATTQTIQQIQYNTKQYNTIQYNSRQDKTIQYNQIQYNTIQYNTIPKLAWQRSKLMYSCVCALNRMCLLIYPILSLPISRVILRWYRVGTGWVQGGYRVAGPEESERSERTLNKHTLWTNMPIVGY